MSAAFFARLKDLETRVETLESDNKWLKDALAKSQAQDSSMGSRGGRTEPVIKPGKAA